MVVAYLYVVIIWFEICADNGGMWSSIEKTRIAIDSMHSWTSKNNY
jgi:hypothetical protein